MSMDLSNQTIDFYQALQASDSEKVFSALISVIQMDEYIDEHLKKQRIKELIDAYHLAKNIA